MSIKHAHSTDHPATNDLRSAVFDIVAQIPRGKVLTYGNIANLIGYPNHARLVGKIMSTAYGTDIPYHRVVSASGALAPNFDKQAALLEAEGIHLSQTGKVPLKKYLWRIETWGL